MTEHRHTYPLLGLTAAALLAAAWRLYSYRPRERIPTDEGMDDPEVSEGFDWTAKMPQMRLMRWFLARRALEMTPRGEAADLGCGPGHLVIKLAQMAPGMRVTGIDLSDDMLGRAEGYACRSGIGERICFKKGDAAQTMFPDNSLDLVVSTLSLHHWSDPVAVLDEVARVLRPGGSFLIFDLRRDVSVPVWLPMWFATHFVVPPALRRANEPLGSLDAAYTPQEASHLAERSQIRSWRVTHGPLWLTIEGSRRDEAR